MDNTGKLFVLESNSLPALFCPKGEWRSADYIIMNEPGGHSAFLENIMRAAVKRHKMKQQN
jgi:hypothetical protein